MSDDFESLTFWISVIWKFVISNFWDSEKVLSFQNALLLSKRFFSLTCTITVTQTPCIYIYQAQDERACRSYRFRNHLNKNSSNLVPRCVVSSALISPYLSLSLLSLPRGAGAFDVWQNKRLSTGLVWSLPLPSKIDSCDPPLRLPVLRLLPEIILLSFCFSSERLYVRSPISCWREEGLRRTGGMPFLTGYAACTSNEPSCTNYRKLVHFLSHSDTSRCLGDRRIVPPNCPSSTRRVFYRRSFYRSATRCFPPGARSFLSSDHFRDLTLVLKF